MRRAVSLAAVPLALLGLLALELRAAWDDTAAPTSGALPVAAASGATATANQVPAADEGLVATILARPLFSPGRRPPAGVAAAAAGLPRLSGVLVSDGGRLAVFAGAEGGRGAAVPEGGTVAGFTVRSIVPGEVTLDGPGGTRILRPGFGGTTVAAASPSRTPLRPTVRDLMRDGLPPATPTPGLPVILGAAPPPTLPPAVAAGSFQQLLAVPVAASRPGVPGLQEPAAAAQPELPR